jgi:hypothetical protein
MCSRVAACMADKPGFAVRLVTAQHRASAVHRSHLLFEIDLARTYVGASSISSLRRTCHLYTPLDTSLETPLHTVSMPTIQGRKSGIANHAKGFPASRSAPFPARRYWFCCLFFLFFDLPIGRPVADPRAVSFLS